ncbi:hypothetical protein NDU88_002804 [Pleurodeles waltl]|uniref:Uncharacterized protein n=1 Tax=Pleurodeles waltl TaxID=8319 RepID=A0AAV7WMJ2_PLEWA|nr:hypothetical protein NDU88_002804 [Pleurodeles waltl]
MMGRGVEGESSVELFWSGVVQCFVVYDVAMAGDVQDEACKGVLDALQPLLEFGRGFCVEGIAVIQFVAYEGLGDSSSGFGNVSERGHVNVEEGRAEGRTLGYAADNSGGLRAEWVEEDSLGSVGEKGGDPVQGSVTDSSIAEA